MQDMNNIKIANDVLKQELAGLSRVQKSFDKEFEKAVLLVAKTKGRVLLSGLGKSGLIGRKIAACFSSVGIPSFFIHPVEAVHGDLGSFEKDDILIALSNSGNTEEMKSIVAFCEKHKIKSISITGNKKSFLATNCDVNIVMDVQGEAIKEYPVPTTSCIMTLAVADALTACVLKHKNFSKELYSEYHSGGSIGKAMRSILNKKHNNNTKAISMKKNTPSTKSKNNNQKKTKIKNKSKK